MEHFDADLYTLVTLFSCIPLRFSFSSPSIDIIPTKSSHLASGHLTVYIRVHTTVVYGPNYIILTQDTNLIQPPSTSVNLTKLQCTTVKIG